MPYLGFDFDASQIEPRESFDPLPTGWYPVLVEDSSIKKTKDGQGQYLELVASVVDGPHKRRKIWDRMNLWHASNQTREIAQKQLSSLARAAGIMHLNDSSALHGRIVQAKVVYVDEQTREGRTYPPKNEVKGYQAMQGATQPQRPVAAPHAVPPAPPPPVAPAPGAQVATGKLPVGRGSAPPWAPQQA